MPSKDSHVAQAEHNGQFWEHLDVARTNYLDWVVVGMFYEAVHWIEASLATKGLHSRNHRERAARMATVHELRNDPNLVRDYGMLRTDSESARYRNYIHTTTDVTGLIPVVSRVRNVIQPLLGQGSTP